MHPALDYSSLFTAKFLEDMFLCCPYFISHFKLNPPLYDFYSQQYINMVVLHVKCLFAKSNGHFRLIQLVPLKASHFRAFSVPCSAYPFSTGSPPSATQFIYWCASEFPSQSTFLAMWFWTINSSQVPLFSSLKIG